MKGYKSGSFFSPIRHIFIHAYATYFELPSNINTMSSQEWIRKGQGREEGRKRRYYFVVISPRIILTASYIWVNKLFHYINKRKEMESLNKNPRLFVISLTPYFFV